MDLVVFEGGFNRPEVEKTRSLKSTKPNDFVQLSAYIPRGLTESLYLLHFERGRENKQTPLLSSPWGDTNRGIQGGGAPNCAIKFITNVEWQSKWFFWSVNKSKNKGLISADRRTKPTLMLTIPRSEQSRLQWIYLSQRLKLRSSMMLRPRPYRYARHIGRGEYRRFPPWIQT